MNSGHWAVIFSVTFAAIEERDKMAFHLVSNSITVEKKIIKIKKPKTKIKGPPFSVPFSQLSLRVQLACPRSKRERNLRETGIRITHRERVSFLFHFYIFNYRLSK